MALDQSMLRAMRWRLAGPHRGGRAETVVGHPTDDLTFYFGAAAGGVFKTNDGGASWESASVGLRTAAVGSLAVNPAEPDIVYAGMGDPCIRTNLSHGDGVYRSVDGGGQWTHLGLTGTRHIARVRLDPSDPDTIYVAALGHVWGPDDERGVFRSRDGGQHWERVLYRGRTAGACDLCLDPGDPRVLYAAIWETRRTPYSLCSGGACSGLFKSVDGGEHWVELTRGLPAGIKGRIGVAASPARAGRLWAIVEAADGGIFRSDDAGETWERTFDGPDQLERPWYFMHIVADPVDPDILYDLNGEAWISSDGGWAFEPWSVPYADNHDMWIDPTNRRRMIVANDGGAAVSFDAGATWSTQSNQPTLQFYHVTVDGQFPYRIYGAAQDAGSVSTPSWSPRGAITRADTYGVGGGEAGSIVVRDGAPPIVFAGNFGGQLTRFDQVSGQARAINVWPDSPIGFPARDVRYRFNWTFPLAISPHDRRVLYAGANHVFRSRDEGATWEVVSPDLTRNDGRFLGDSGGPITRDNYTTEYYCTLYALAESPVRRGVLWAGSDDGLIHVSDDDGGSWVDVTPPELPELAWISTIEPSPHDASSCYVAATRYRLDDARPYLLKTDDLGQSWTAIVDGIDADAITRVIRADPRQPGLLFAGAETAVYVSFDDGARWCSLQLNLPVAPIYDLAISWTGDLVAGTHGRSFWILDDLSGLRGIAASGAPRSARLFPVRTAYRLQVDDWTTSAGPVSEKVNIFDLATAAHRRESPGGGEELEIVDAGANGPSGMIVNYWLSTDETAAVKVVVSDAGSERVRFHASSVDGGVGAPTHAAGVNRFVWDMRVDGPVPVEHSGPISGPRHRGGGPVIPPGDYEVDLFVGEQRVGRETVRVALDPRSPADEASARRQFALLVEIDDLISSIHALANRVQTICARLLRWGTRLEADQRHARLADTASALRSRLLAETGGLVRLETYHNVSASPPTLGDRLSSLGRFVAMSDFEPTAAMREVHELLAAEIDRRISELAARIRDDVGTFDRDVGQLGLGLDDE